MEWFSQLITNSETCTREQQQAVSASTACKAYCIKWHIATRQTRGLERNRERTGCVTVCDSFYITSEPERGPGRIVAHCSGTLWLIHMHRDEFKFLSGDRVLSQKSYSSHFGIGIHPLLCAVQINSSWDNCSIDQSRGNNSPQGSELGSIFVCVNRPLFLPFPYFLEKHGFYYIFLARSVHCSSHLLHRSDPEKRGFCWFFRVRSVQFHFYSHLRHRAHTPH